MKNKKPELIIVGGPNGCGKSTIAYEYSKVWGIKYLGADDIANELKNKGLLKSDVAAGKEFFRRLDGIFKKKSSIIIESTLSGLGLFSKISELRKCGYSVTIVFVFLESADLCKKRVKIRVKKGGHNVPPKDIERRYFRSIKNFWKKYRYECDSWQLLYNGKSRPLEIALNENEVVNVFDDEYFKIFKDIAR